MLQKAGPAAQRPPRPGPTGILGGGKSAVNADPVKAWCLRNLTQPAQIIHPVRVRGPSTLQLIVQGCHALTG